MGECTAKQAKVPYSVQDDTESNVLPEIDMLMTANALTAAWDLLLCHPLDLLQPFLQSQGTHALQLQMMKASCAASKRTILSTQSSRAEVIIAVLLKVWYLTAFCTKYCLVD